MDYFHVLKVNKYITSIIKMNAALDDDNKSKSTWAKKKLGAVLEITSTATSKNKGKADTLSS